MHLTPTDPCLMQGHPELISSPDPTLPCSHLSWVSETPCLRLNFLQITNYPRQGLGSYGLSGRWSEGERREWTWGNDLETGRKQGVLQAVEPLCPLGDDTTHLLQQVGLWGSWVTGSFSHLSTDFQSHTRSRCCWLFLFVILCSLLFRELPSSSQINHKKAYSFLWMPGLSRP